MGLQLFLALSNKTGLFKFPLFFYQFDNEKINRARIEQNMKAAFLVNSVNRWLGIRLELLSASFICLAVTLALIQRGFVSPSLAALSVWRY